MAVAVTTPDYPHLRRLAVCPCCERVKQPGCVVCWPCYRLHGFKYGPDKAVTAKLVEAEKAAAPAFRQVSRGVYLMEF